jgi:hypothetical protein
MMALFFSMLYMEHSYNRRGRQLFRHQTKCMPRTIAFLRRPPSSRFVDGGGSSTLVKPGSVAVQNVFPLHTLPSSCMFHKRRVATCGTISQAISGMSAEEHLNRGSEIDKTHSRARLLDFAVRQRVQSVDPLDCLTLCD